jgi:hypothetical protein
MRTHSILRTEVKLCLIFLIVIGALALVPAVWSTLFIRHVGWLLYVGLFILLFVQWVGFLVRGRAFPNPRVVWAASTTYFALTSLGALASAAYYVWRFFQPEPFTFNGDGPLPFDLVFIPLLLSLIPLTCLALSVFLFRHSHEYV